MQLFKGKWNDLQKVLRYLSGIVTVVFEGGTGGHGGQSPSGETGCFGGSASVFLFIFILYLNDLPSKSSSTLSGLCI